MRAVVVALGDLGRSARMLYHAQALAANGLDVDLVGFEGTPLPKAVADDLRIKVRRLRPATLRLRRVVSGQAPPAGRLARWLERRDARRVEANLCVSRGLAAFLESRFGVQQARVLYDRPASAFVPMDRADRERLRQALFTRLGVHGGMVAFIVCPTSW